MKDYFCISLRQDFTDFSKIMKVKEGSSRKASQNNSKLSHSKTTSDSRAWNNDEARRIDQETYRKSISDRWQVCLHTPEPGPGPEPASEVWALRLSCCLSSRTLGPASSVTMVTSSFYLSISPKSAVNAGLTFRFLSVTRWVQTSQTPRCSDQFQKVLTASDRFWLLQQMDDQLKGPRHDWINHHNQKNRNSWLPETGPDRSSYYQNPPYDDVISIRHCQSSCRWTGPVGWNSFNQYQSEINNPHCRFWLSNHYVLIIFWW